MFRQQEEYRKLLKNNFSAGLTTAWINTRFKKFKLNKSVGNLCFSIEDVKQHLYMTVMMPKFAGHCNSA
jgi:hypothetical protein